MGHWSNANTFERFSCKETIDVTRQANVAESFEERSGLELRKKNCFMKN